MSQKKRTVVPKERQETNPAKRMGSVRGHRNTGPYQ